MSKNKNIWFNRHECAWALETSGYGTSENCVFWVLLYNMVSPIPLFLTEGHNNGIFIFVFVFGYPSQSLF